MNIRSQGFAHGVASNIGNCMQRETIVELIMVHEVFPDTVYDKMKQLMFFVKEERNGEVSNLLFRELLRRNQVDGFEMAKVEVPAEDVNVK